MPAERHMNLFYAALSIFFVFFSPTTSKVQTDTDPFEFNAAVEARGVFPPHRFLSALLLSTAMQVSVGITSGAYLLFFFCYFVARELEW